MEGAGGDESRLVCFERGWRKQVEMRVDWFVLIVDGGSRWGMGVDRWVVAEDGGSRWG